MREDKFGGLLLGEALGEARGPPERGRRSLAMGRSLSCGHLEMKKDAGGGALLSPFKMYEVVCGNCSQQVCVWEVERREGDLILCCF